VATGFSVRRVSFFHFLAVAWYDGLASQDKIIATTDKKQELRDRIEFCMHKLDSGLSQAAVVHLCCQTFSCARATGYRNVKQAQNELAKDRSENKDLQNSGMTLDTKDIELLLITNALEAAESGDAESVAKLITSLDKVKRWHGSATIDVDQQAEKIADKLSKRFRYHEQ
jgi:hypothetical protein